jgi:hypothetical protein
VEGDTLVLSESRFAAWSADGTDYEVRRPMGFALEPTSAESTCAIWSQASVAAAALIDSLGGVQ